MNDRLNRCFSLGIVSLLISVLFISCKDNSSGTDQSNRNQTGSFTAKISDDIEESYSGSAVFYFTPDKYNLSGLFLTVAMEAEDQSFRMEISHLNNGPLQESVYNLTENGFIQINILANLLDVENYKAYELESGELTITTSEPGNTAGEYSFIAQRVIPSRGHSIEVEGSFNSVCQDSQEGSTVCEYK